MQPGNYQLNIYQGDTHRWSFRLWADEDQSSPVDMSGATAAAEIRDKPGGTVLTDMGCSITGNSIDMLLTAANSRLIVVNGVWDLEITFASGDVQTVLKGKVLLTADVTHSS